MASIRQLASCIGLPGDISIIKDFYGYERLDPGNSWSLSLLEQARLLQGKHFHLNLIRVGSDQFIDKHEDEITGALIKMRGCYATVSLGIGRVEHYFIPTSLANGQEIIESKPEGELLTNEWTRHNDGLDVFLVLLITIAEDGLAAGGFSPVDGPGDKDSKGMTGVVVEVGGSGFITGHVGTGGVLAHEIGHYLGLEHIIELDEIDDPGSLPPIITHNVMFPFSGPHAMFSGKQGKIMKKHPFVRSGC